MIISQVSYRTNGPLVLLCGDRKIVLGPGIFFSTRCDLLIEH